MDDSFFSFWSHLKCHLFRKCFPPSLARSPLLLLFMELYGFLCRTFTGGHLFTCVLMCMCTHASFAHCLSPADLNPRRQWACGFVHCSRASASQCSAQRRLPMTIRWVNKQALVELNIEKKIQILKIMCYDDCNREVWCYYELEEANLKDTWVV